MKKDERGVMVQNWPEWRWFETMQHLLEDAISRIQQSDAREISAIFPFLDSSNESLASLGMLIKQLKLRDAYVIARVVYETSLNACFLITDPQVLSLRAHTHAKQKALRGLVRAIEISGKKIFEFKAEGVEALMQRPRHKEWLEEFTSKSGREVTSWTAENVSQRLEAVYSKFGSNATRGLAFGLLLYRHASEIAHGTLFGTLFSWGAMEVGKPLSNLGDMSKFRKKSCAIF
ncbi:DUF5677 domain-containing protein [Pseudomonas putida]|uniref:DUF5677 domain-containing protein n=1 Tax=Pseudomonas putida TaxID=303 RepID=UPI001E2B45A5|nr:DUF5677 domain-containing protein [Pseudomonas putida]MCE0974124.1 DUF5677 domain-containing protein [Pseudomonas putida]MDD2120855.1 DUF5677 domain-containing protein [Pseudomonas putida]HDS1731372.1 hypothetical protein [Pseudomonas putida]